MKGEVKWFSLKKGYGFLSDEDGKDRYFNIKSISDSSGLRSGCEVEFDPFEGKKGFAANNVRIIEKRNIEYLNGRVICLHCGKHMIPRVITGPPNAFFYQKRWIPVPYKSICPFCGNTHTEFLNESNDYFLLKLLITMFMIIYIVVNINN